MTEKGYQWGVKALRKKRAEIAGDIAQLQVQVRHRRRDLKRVDDILRILAPGSDPTTIPAKKPVKHLNVFRHGQLNALILGILGASKTPMTNIAVLEALMARPGVVFSRAQLEEKLYSWKDDVSSNAVEVYIHGLRKKLGSELIQNVRGLGYVIPRL